MKATRAVSRREIKGKNNSPAWLYKLDNGKECTTHGMSKESGLNLSPQTFAARIKRFGYKSPKVFMPKKFGQSKRGKSKTISSVGAKELLTSWLSEHNVKTRSAYVEIPGYEPVLVDDGACLTLKSGGDDKQNNKQEPK